MMRIACPGPDGFRRHLSRRHVFDHRQGHRLLNRMLLLDILPSDRKSIHGAVVPGRIVPFRDDIFAQHTAERIQDRDSFPSPTTGVPSNTIRLRFVKRRSIPVLSHRLAFTRDSPASMLMPRWRLSPTTRSSCKTLRPCWRCRGRHSAVGVSELNMANGSPASHCVTTSGSSGIRPRNGTPMSMRRCFPPALSEHFDMVVAMRAFQPAHILDDPDDRHFAVFAKGDRFSRIQQRHFLRRRHDDRAR